MRKRRRGGRRSGGRGGDEDWRRRAEGVFYLSFQGERIHDLMKKMDKEAKERKRKVVACWMEVVAEGG